MSKYLWFTVIRSKLRSGCVCILAVEASVWILSMSEFNPQLWVPLPEVKNCSDGSSNWAPSTRRCLWSESLSLSPCPRVCVPQMITMKICYMSSNLISSAKGFNSYSLIMKLSSLCGLGNQGTNRLIAQGHAVGEFKGNKWVQIIRIFTYTLKIHKDSELALESLGIVLIAHFVHKRLCIGKLAHALLHVSPRPRFSEVPLDSLSLTLGPKSYRYHSFSSSPPFPSAFVPDWATSLQHQHNLHLENPLSAWPVPISPIYCCQEATF